MAPWVRCGVESPSIAAHANETTNMSWPAGCAAERAEANTCLFIISTLARLEDLGRQADAFRSFAKSARQRLFSLSNHVRPVTTETAYVRYGRCVVLPRSACSLGAHSPMHDPEESTPFAICSRRGNANSDPSGNRRSTKVRVALLPGERGFGATRNLGTVPIWPALSSAACRRQVRKGRYPISRGTMGHSRTEMDDVRRPDVSVGARAEAECHPARHDSYLGWAGLFRCSSICQS